MSVSAGQIISELDDMRLARIKADRKRIESLTKQRDDLVEACRDALGGWRYIRQSHGDLYGVGWDRVEQKLEAALAAVEGTDG